MTIKTAVGTNQRSPNWKGYPKRRCCIIGCRKRAREIIDGKPYCKVHRK